ncbi:hypothetical protein UNDKW_3974 [Undibacterium sp. KW1]|uniref:hypothetical protein n=1 Tax=Undibacterium sp. KW1 TaxID=2058624 RepID=UPI001331F1F6|nr:hypothetical protein [Undibacterium sp. KW1]BBB62247.1 hypothetical protein UNDKW_3974 [Undibacterium sp. KW1]
MQISENTRRSALLLHSMSEADKQWVLGNLHSQDTQILKQLLSELNELGMPADKELLSGLSSTDKALPVSAKISTWPANVADLSMEQQIACLDRADYRNIFGVLADESTELVAYFLQIHPWTWKKEFLACFDASKARRIQETKVDIKEPYLSEPDVRPKKLQHALIAEIIQQVPAPRTPVYQTDVLESAGMFGRLLRRLGLGSANAVMRKEY